MRVRVAGALIGVVFGFTICWSGMTSPEVIRGALLFRESYLFSFMGAAMITATAGLALVRGHRALLTGAKIAWTDQRPGRAHVVGALMFGTGWGLTDVCPGPVATQLGQGIGWSLLTLTGVLAGVWLYQRQGARETEPAREPLDSADRTPAFAAGEPA